MGFCLNGFRKLYLVKATVLQENHDEQVIENSFPSTSSPGSGIEQVGESRVNSSSSGLERWVIKDSVIKIVDTLYTDRDNARFFVLETIATVPYFAFIYVVHLYESVGWWRADYLKVHFAESWNEMHHLLIVEELGGNSWWFDRFLAQHTAVFYYFMTIFMYALSPKMAYNLYDVFVNIRDVRLMETFGFLIHTKMALKTCLIAGFLKQIVKAP